MASLEHRQTTFHKFIELKAGARRDSRRNGQSPPPQNANFFSTTHFHSSFEILDFDERNKKKILFLRPFVFHAHVTTLHGGARFIFSSSAIGPQSFTAM